MRSVKNTYSGGRKSIPPGKLNPKPGNYLRAAVMAFTGPQRASTSRPQLCPDLARPRRDKYSCNHPAALTI